MLDSFPHTRAYVHCLLAQMFRFLVALVCSIFAPLFLLLVSLFAN